MKQFCKYKTNFTSHHNTPCQKLLVKLQLHSTSIKSPHYTRDWSILLSTKKKPKPFESSNKTTQVNHSIVPQGPSRISHNDGQ